MEKIMLKKMMMAKVKKNEIKEMNKSKEIDKR